jgi:ATP-dependent Clp protease ATP-binding subunit ClpC
VSTLPPLGDHPLRLLDTSRALARRQPRAGWSPLHVLLALCDEGGGPLAALHPNLAALRAAAEASLACAVSHGPSLDELAAGARIEAALAGAGEAATEHLLRALASLEPSAGVLAAAGLSRAELDLFLGPLRRRVERWALPFSHFRALATFGTDLTELARRGVLDPVIDREGEIERVMQVLGRRAKNTPVLVGYPGVGKTAVVLGLAQRVAAGRVPARMRYTRIVQLDPAALIAGARARGQFEERLQAVLHEVHESEGGIVLFVDEFHAIAGAGASEGGFDFAQMIKLALAAGDLRLIGATTPEEYRRSLERDAALERRLTPVWVPEPSPVQTLAILHGLRPRLEDHHGVTLTDGALAAAVRLAARYVTGRFLPDKAIDLVDEAAARAALTARPAANPGAALAGDGAGVESVAAAYLARLRAQVAGRPAVTEEDVAALVAAMTGIPVARVQEQEADRLLRLEERLHRRVVGQDHAVSLLAAAIRRARTGLSDPRRPLGSFIFLGPSGVGKTELARALAEALFDDPDALVRLDMSEYMERHNVARLFGAPPGYVGYDDAGTLTEPVRRRPYRVILFDEIEKAHPDVFNVLLQILDAGRLTDGHGRTADFRNTVIILTSNLGTVDETEAAHLAKSDNGRFDRAWLEARIGEALRRTFRPELRNRIDEVVVFEPLSRRDLYRIVDLQLADMRAALALRGVTLTLTPAAREALVREGFSITFGARPLRRTVQTRLLNPLAERFLQGSIPPGSWVVAGFSAGRLTFRVRRDTAPAAPPVPPADRDRRVPAAAAAAPPRRRLPAGDPPIDLI